MAENSPGARIAPVILGGLALSGLQLYRLLNAPPGAAYGWLIGSFVGCVVGTIVTVVLVARTRPAPPPPIPSADERHQAADKYRRWSIRMYRVCAVAWVITGLGFAALIFVESESVAAAIGIPTLSLFTVGLLALILGKGLGDATKRAADESR